MSQFPKLPCFPCPHHSACCNYGSTVSPAEAKAIEMVSNANEKFFHDRAALSRQLDVLEKTLTTNSKFILPGNADLVAVLGLEAGTQPALLPIRRGEGGSQHPPGGSPPRHGA